MPTVEADRWREYLASHPQAHFLQTGEWADLKSHFGWEAKRLIVGTSGAQILFRSLPLGYTIAYIGKPAATQIATSEAGRFWAEVDALCRAKRAILCKFEPDTWADAAIPNSEEGITEGKGPTIVPSPHNIQPRRTIIVGLEHDEQDMLGRMKQKCRYNIRLAEKKGVRVRAWADVRAFHNMLLRTAERDAFAVHSYGYYQLAYELLRPAGLCELLVAEYEGEPLAALMVFARGQRAWYVYGGSSDKERERMPNYLLQWEAMRWAKQRGCTEYDLWGVPDVDAGTLESSFEKRSDGLWGVYRFKRGFGGEVRRAAQAVDRVYNPMLYRLYLMRASAREA